MQGIQERKLNKTEKRKRKGRKATHEEFCCNLTFFSCEKKGVETASMGYRVSDYDAIRGPLS